MCKHYECIFYSAETRSCDFAIIMGHMRGCPPTDDCKEFRTSTVGVKPILKEYHWKRKDPEIMRRLEKYVYECKSAPELARKARTSITQTQNWLVKAHPEMEWYTIRRVDRGFYNDDG